MTNALIYIKIQNVLDLGGDVPMTEYQHIWGSVDNSLMKEYENVAVNDLKIVR